ncbi:MAG TPA: hypothetical protein VN920_12405 [Pyrinomonadaceae bacterium]|nr:hypothetical protein [Pyrinomonadaceae bacterium]
MNCEKFQKVAADLARNETMEAGERASALAHTDKCQRCGQAWSDQRELSEGLRTIAEQMKSLQAPVQLEEKLRAAFRDRTFARPSRSAPPRWRYWATAAAAVLLIVFGLMAWRFRVASLRHSPVQAKSKVGATPQAQSPKPDQAPVAVTAGNQIQHESVSPRRPVVDRGLAKSQPARPGDDGASGKAPITDAASGLAANSESKEVATDFVALGYGSALDLQDGGQLVRVELPRSALARFGLPMNMDRADERVKADVLVGADGLARAIRFVK